MYECFGAHAVASICIFNWQLMSQICFPVLWMSTRAIKDAHCGSIITHNLVAVLRHLDNKQTKTQTYRHLCCYYVKVGMSIEIGL